ncbi:hypothetical protein V8D89_009233 [Ganoderma adspersum]
MRLLETDTGQFAEFTDLADLRYAILSHTWDANGEQTYRELRKLRKAFTREDLPLLASLPDPGHAALAKDHLSLHRSATWSEPEPSSPSKPPSPSDTCSSTDTMRASSFLDDGRISMKIRMACTVAREHGYRYIWIDSCCIDKSSSTELSEAINSMYLWYSRATICYAWLADVPDDDEPDVEDSAFRRSRWFTRGWTLQELIAPRLVIFLSDQWGALGTKATLATVVEEVTRIDQAVLLHQKSLEQVGVAERMSWASERATTRVEDQAYALLGIFDINMPTLYGEGTRAFRRLQEEILKRIPDQSLFAWGDAYLEPLPETEDALLDQRRFVCLTKYSARSLFAASSAEFLKSGSIRPVPHSVYLRRLGLSNVPLPEYASSPYGTRLQLPTLPISLCLPPWSVSYQEGSQTSEWCFALLACEHSRRPGHLLARVCRVVPSLHSQIEELHSGFVAITQARHYGGYPKSFTLSPSQITQFRSNITNKMIYLPHQQRIVSPSPNPTVVSRAFKMTLSPWASSVLQKQGYDIAFRNPTQTPPSTYGLFLSRDDHTLKMEFEYSQDSFISQEGLRVAVWDFHLDATLSTAQTDPEAPRPCHQVWWETQSGFPDFELVDPLGNEVTLQLGLDPTPGSSNDSFDLRVEVIHRRTRREPISLSAV